jgi:hypothetical protein
MKIVSVIVNKNKTPIDASLVKIAINQKDYYLQQFIG